MGVDLFMVNPDRKQFFDPDVLGTSNRQSGYMCGSWGQAVGLLVSQRDEINRKLGPLPGTWYGNRVIAAGEDGRGGAHGFEAITATPDAPHRSLFETAYSEFEDISYKVVTMLSLAFDDYAEARAQRANAGGYELFALGTTVFLLEHDPPYESGCVVIRRALESALGDKWMARYKEESNSERLSNLADRLKMPPKTKTKFGLK